MASNSGIVECALIELDASDADPGRTRAEYTLPAQLTRDAALALAPARKGRAGLTRQATRGMPAALADSGVTARTKRAISACAMLSIGFLGADGRRE
jgi:hypothetical protein